MNNIQELIKQFAQTHEKEFMRKIIEEMKFRDKLWVAYSPVTRNHYVEYYNGIPTAYIFSEPDYCEAFAEYLRSKRILIRPMESDKAARVPMFSDFFRNGIEQVIVDNGQTFIVIELLDIIKRPDFSSIPENERPLINPSLMKCANIFFQCMNMENIDHKAEGDLMREIFDSKYLLPIVFGDKAPKGLSLRPISVGGAAIKLAVIRRSDGSCYIPVFTDWVELGKCDKEKLCCGNIVSFSDIETFCVNGEFVSINPLGFNMLLDKTTVNSIRNRFGASKPDERPSEPESTPAQQSASRNAVQPAQQSAPHNAVQPAQQAAPRNAVQPAQQSAPRNAVQPAQQAAPRNAAPSAETQAGQAARSFGGMTFYAVNDAPVLMMRNLREQLERTPGILAAFLKGVRRNGVSGYLVIVDFSGTDPSAFQLIAQQVGPLTGGVALNFVAYNSEIGRAASADTAPFYQRNMG